MITFQCNLRKEINTLVLPWHKFKNSSIRIQSLMFKLIIKSTSRLLPRGNLQIHVKVRQVHQSFQTMKNNY